MRRRIRAPSIDDKHTNDDNDNSMYMNNTTNNNTNNDNTNNNNTNHNMCNNVITIHFHDTNTDDKLDIAMVATSGWLLLSVLRVCVLFGTSTYLFL